VRFWTREVRDLIALSSVDTEEINLSHSCISSSGFLSVTICILTSSISRFIRAIFSSNVSVREISSLEVRYACFLCFAINVSEKSRQPQFQRGIPALSASTRSPANLCLAASIESPARSMSASSSSDKEV